MKTFQNFHPVTLLCYFVFILIIAIFSFNPIFLSISLFGAFMFLLTISDVNSVIKGLWGYVLLFLLITVTNPLFSHNGATPMFFINDSRITLEAVIYGMILGIMIVGVLLWFKSFNIVFSSDKILYIFGRFFPRICLVFSMALNFVPMLVRNFKSINSAQKAMMTNSSRVHRYLTSFSAVITRGIESSIETSDSMRARAYSTCNRTHYSIFTFKIYDFIYLAISVVLFVFSLSGIVTGSTTAKFYPYFVLSSLTLWSVLSYISYFLLAFLPFIFEVKESLKWKFLISKI